MPDRSRVAAKLGPGGVWEPQPDATRGIEPIGSIGGSWPLTGGPYDGLTVKTGENEPPLAGVAVFPDRLEVHGDEGIRTYVLIRGPEPHDPVRGVYEAG